MSSQRVLDMDPRILYTTADASPQSGALRCMLDISRHIGAHGYQPMLALRREARDISALTPSDLQRASFLDIPRPRRGRSVGYYMTYALKTARSVQNLVRLIQREHVALVHANEILDLYGGMAAKIAGVPCVWHVRADLTMAPRLRWLLSSVVLALAARVVVPSESVRERMFGERARGRLVVLYEAGPDSRQFRPGVDGSSVRKEFGIPSDAFLVTLVAKLAEVKGHETLVRSAPEVLLRHPNTYFMIVGGELDGPHHQEYARRLKALPGDLGISDRVLFVGFRGDVPRVMAAADVLTHCSTYPDPFPGVVLQGMALGKPVIASDLGGAREQIADGISGLLVEPGNPGALSSALCALLDDAAARRRLGDSAAASIVRRFPPERFVSQLCDLYADVLSGPLRGDDLH